jgi:cellulose synthase/poly-beta-1,6-N-acetylglucosamine synthase-like glycosyltransferase
VFPPSWVALGALLLVPFLLIACDAAGGLRAGQAPNNRRIHTRGRRALRDAMRTYEPVEDFEILVPIYGEIRYLENIGFLRPYGKRVVLCTTTEETAEFNTGLEHVARANGFRIFRGVVERAASTGKRATGGTVRDRLVRDAVGEVEAEYVVCMDADTTCSRPLGELVGALAARHLDMASVRLVPANRSASFLTRLQAHEYRFAMHMRTVVPWLVSGACHVARTDVHREVMSRHSLFFQGNDLEVGVLATALGFDVGHIRYEVATNVPVTLRPWFRQRLAWAAGEVRLFLANPQIAIRHPLFWFYGALLVILASPLRWESLFQPGIPLLAVGVSYCLLLFYFHFEHRDRYLLLLPFYGLFTSLVMVPLGVFAYTRMVLRDRNFGFIRLQRGEELRRNWRARRVLAAMGQRRPDAA